MEESDPQPHHPRPKVTNACEACRAAKVKCQASNQLGICRRCLDSKRECVFKTGPRTRRPRQSKLADPGVPRPPPPPGPSKTFTIDIPMSADNDVHESWDTLRSQHESFIDELVPDMSDGDEEWFDAPTTSSVTAPSVTGSGISGSSLPVGASATHTPPSSVASRGPPKRSITSALGLQPQFNLESAAALLEVFRGPMLANFPCIVLPDNATVTSLAKDRPFVLLAILAAAGSSTSLQGHSLYDDEFRKILGLKFVAGGERSLELLQGLVIYVAWYPFHLRPKNRQAFQYIRMAVDIISDLELDQDPNSEDAPVLQNEERLEEVRTYLAAYHLICTFSWTWNKTASLQYTPYVKQCCDIMGEHGLGMGDNVLAWQVRIQRIIEETGSMRQSMRPGDAAQTYQQSLLVKGMEAELNQWQQIIPPEVASTLCIRVLLLIAHIFLTAAPLLKLPMPKPKKNATPTKASGSPLIIAAELRAKLPALRELFELYTHQPAAALNAFSSLCWSRLILSIIMGFRLSFAMPDCEGWDDAAVRRELGFGDYLEQMTRMGENDGGEGLTPASSRKNMDVLGASKVVLKTMLDKYRKRVARVERARCPVAGTSEMQGGMGMGMGDGLNFLPPESMKLDKTVAGCPMIDGSMDAYFPLWDETFANPNFSGGMPTTGLEAPAGPDIIGGDLSAGPAATMPEQQAPYPDLWATMTMGWAQNEINFDNI